uniref:Uncharacterized protein n=1 Tax=Avena sativa TaxID=4498 RepID=A0ACD5TU41_AVESA
MAAGATTSCFSWLKEALLSVPRNLKVLSPFLLFAVLAFPIVPVKIVYVWPLTAEMVRHITQMEEHTTDPSSAEYARLLEEVRHEAGELFLISVAIALVLLVLAFCKQIVACFTTYPGGDDRRSLTEILGGVVKYVKGPLVVAAVVTMLQVTAVALVSACADTLLEVLPVFMMFFFYPAASVFVWLADWAMVIVAAASVLDHVVEVTITLTGEGCPRVRGLEEACRLITEVRTMEGFVPVLVTLLLPTVLIPLYAVALLYTKQSTAMGLYYLRLLSADKYFLLSGVYGLCYLRAACAYASQRCYYLQATESKDEVVAASDDYAQIPSDEPQVIVKLEDSVHL